MSGPFIRDFPFNDEIVVTKGEHVGKATQELQDWASSVQLQASNSPVAPEPATVLLDISTNEIGSLAVDQVAGFYRVSAYREVVITDPVSSGLDLEIGWTHNGKALSRVFPFSGTPQTINDTESVVTVMEIDPGTVISYSLVYASNTPTLARFSATIIAELLQSVA